MLFKAKRWTNKLNFVFSTNRFRKDSTLSSLWQILVRTIALNIRLELSNDYGPLWLRSFFNQLVFVVSILGLRSYCDVIREKLNEVRASHFDHSQRMAIIVRLTQVDSTIFGQDWSDWRHWLAFNPWVSTEKSQATESLFKTPQIVSCDTGSHFLL